MTSRANENTLFVQLLVGGRLVRQGVNAWFLGGMAFFTLVFGPAALLLMLEIMFLPYHSELITWEHRIFLAIDLVLVLTLWPVYRSGWGMPSWPRKSLWLCFVGFLSAAAGFYAVTVATFPDEHMYLWTEWLHRIGPPSTLDLHGEDLIDDAKLARIIEKNGRSSDVPRWEPILVVKGRDLTEANLTNADVRQIDFSSATLNRANLVGAWATAASFFGAHLLGAQLGIAQLQGVQLNGAELYGASLFGARLQGASLDLAKLQGAWLDFARLQGASLGLAQLEGASLKSALLQGTELDGAQLQGALLDGAQLQGASLRDAQLEGASLENVYVWRADARKATWANTRVFNQQSSPKHVCLNQGFIVSDWSANSFEKFKQELRGQIPPSFNRQKAMAKIAGLDPTQVQEEEGEIANAWLDQARSSPTQEIYEKSLTELWRETGCAAEGAPYVLQSLAARFEPSFDQGSPFAKHSAEKAKLAAAFLDAEHCPGARGLSGDEIAKLKAIRDNTPPPSAKQ
jgi:uncharacterized protein YjbI with pentapeptide repeats